jgi:predicted TIM-barrel fold metal-dependent hydrolase
MTPTSQSISEELYDYTASRPILNTHSHQLPEKEYRDFDLDALFRNAYINWCGVQWDHTFESRRNLLEKVRFHSAYVWLSKSLRDIYKLELPLNESTWEDWSGEISKAHRDPSFRGAILANLCRYRRIILDAYWRPGSDNDDPRLFAPTYRVNAFFFGYSPTVVDSDGNNPYRLYSGNWIKELSDYIAWVHQMIAEAKRDGAVAIKVPIAYDRGLDFTEISPQKARLAFSRLVKAAAPSARGSSLPPEDSIPSNAPVLKAFPNPEPGVDPQDLKDFQDYLFFSVCHIAAQLDLPVQIHTGTGQGRRTNALWLQEAIEKNPSTRFVLLHCSYPWVQDVVPLVTRYANVYPDLSMLPLFSTQASKSVLHELLEATTAEKVAWGCDTWTPEESYGSLLAFRQIATSVLQEKISAGYFSIQDACQILDNIMFKNAAQLYQLDPPDTVSN